MRTLGTVGPILKKVPKVVFRDLADDKMHTYRNAFSLGCLGGLLPAHAAAIIVCAEEFSPITSRFLVLPCTCMKKRQEFHHVQPMNKERCLDFSDLFISLLGPSALVK